MKDSRKEDLAEHLPVIGKGNSQMYGPTRTGKTTIVSAPTSKILELLSLVFKGPVAWTRKRLETGPNQTYLDQTTSCCCTPFQRDEMLTTKPDWLNGCNHLKIHLENTLKKHLKTL